jgi:hypothetical protein
MVGRLSTTPRRGTKDRGLLLAPASRPPAGVLKKEISLAEVLDRVLHKGAVVVGEITITVANVDLLYLGINLILASMGTIEREFTRSHGKKFTQTR